MLGRIRSLDIAFRHATTADQITIGVVSGGAWGGLSHAPKLAPKPLIMDNIFSQQNQHIAHVCTVTCNHLRIYYFHYPSGMLEDGIH